ncbi:MAG: sigma-54 dependent transcriptional regulator [Proteobacteria bacterium]|nr:sigma-54 dependent transcriptional regulator [Pseudomonadota bacterium]
MTHVLVVDDESAHRLMLRAHLEEAGHRVSEAADGVEAVEAVAGALFDLVLLDQRMPNLDGLEALTSIKRLRPDLPVIMMTAYGSIENAVRALKLGAADYVTKPLDIEELMIKIGRTLDHVRLAEEHQAQRERLDARFDFSALIGESAPMRRIKDGLKLIAPSTATVLITGESGTGKEVLANVIHQNSDRAGGRFVAVNCAALPEQLLESELFGHEKGAFTGAVARKKGRFELADGGTVFLDEIGEMSPATQAKFLRVLQERSFETVGGVKPVTVDVRVIAATNKDLAAEVAAGRFRDDLLYRLNVITIDLPPLKDRLEDLPLLVEHFMGLYNESNHRRVRGLAPEVIEVFRRHDWPGNVRELANVIERGVILARGDLITRDELPGTMRPAEDSPGEGRLRPGMSIKDAERLLIEQTLIETGGNRTKASELLGITRKTLLNKIKEYELDL